MVRSVAELFEQDDEQFVRSAYHSILGRAPDPEGLGNYVELIRTGIPKQQIVIALSKSPEASTSKKELLRIDAEQDDMGGARAYTVSFDELILLQDRRFIHAAYLRILGREADKEGMSIYLTQLRCGLSKIAILGHIEDSKESRDRQATIKEWYRVTRASAPIAAQGDGVGPEILDTKRAKESSILPTAKELFSYSSKEIIHIVHRCLLGRSPSLESVNFYMSEIARGRSKKQLVAKILASDEINETRIFHGRVTTQIAKYRWGQLPIIGKFIRVVTGIEGEWPDDRRLRRIENQLFQIRDEPVQMMVGSMAQGAPPRERWDVAGGEAEILNENHENPEADPVVIIRGSPSTLLRTFASRNEN